MAAPWSKGAQARIIGELHGQTTVNVFHFGTNEVVNDQGALDELLLQLVQALADCVVETLLPAVTSDWRFVKCDGHIIYPAPSDPLEASGLPEHVGTRSATSHSVSSSLLRIKSGQGGRSGKGRVFLPPPGEAEIAASVIDGPTLVLLAAFAACMATKFMGPDKETFWTLGVLSKKISSQAGVGFDGGFFQATSLSPVADLSYLGSRRKGRGV